MAKRNKGIRIPVSDEELEIIRELAEINHLSMATYLRNLALQDKKEREVK